MNWRNWMLEYFFFKGHNHVFSTILIVCLFNNFLESPFWRVTPRERPGIDGITKQTQADLLA